MIHCKAFDLLIQKTGLREILHSQAKFLMLRKYHLYLISSKFLPPKTEMLKCS